MREGVYASSVRSVSRLFFAAWGGWLFGAVNLFAQAPRYVVGLDIGSTTVKVAVLDMSESDPVLGRPGRLVYSDYQRHQTKQGQKALEMLQAVEEGGDGKDWPGIGWGFALMVTGSGGPKIAEALGVEFAQEVEANVHGVMHYLSQVGIVIELGGEDSKVVIMREDPVSGVLEYEDLFMNSTCAGGTGAFLEPSQLTQGQITFLNYFGHPFQIASGEHVEKLALSMKFIKF